MPGETVAIRNAVIHPLNDQPLLVDLFAEPSATDSVVVCTNVRTVAGKRPSFVDHSESVFYFPYTHVRFLEIPPGADGKSPPPDTARRPEPEAEPELEIDEDFLRRVRDV